MAFEFLDINAHVIVKRCRSERAASSGLAMVLSTSGDEAGPGYSCSQALQFMGLDHLFHRELLHKASNKEALAYSRSPGPCFA